MSNKELFDLFDKNKDRYELYNAVIKHIDEEVFRARGKLAAEHYNTLRLLSNSINNAGWEGRHSEQISTINQASHKICDEFEEFLP